ncbi:hypothetical protein DRQ33_00765 [bacterium]|nr:MAG: hypothetical protein DRQ33_00765 [bacterium]
MILWRKTLGYAIGRGISSTIAFLLLPVLTRLMTPTEFGAWQIAEFWALLVMFSIRLGMEQALFKFYVTIPQKRKIILFNVLTVIAVMSSLFLIFGYLFRHTLSWIFLGTQFHSKFAIMIILWGIADSLFSTLASVFQAEERVKLFALMDISRGALGYGFAILLLIKGFGVSGVISARLGASFAIVITVIPAILSRVKFKFDPKTATAMLKYGIPLTLNLFVVRIFSFSDRWLLAKLADFSAAGTYSAGVKIAAIIVVILMPIRYAWSARLFHLYQSGILRNRLPDVWRQLSGAMAIIASALILLSPEIFKLLIGPGYESGMKIIPILAGAYFLDSFILIADAGIYLRGKTIFVPIFTAIAAIINIGLNILWIPRYGALGAAVSALIGFFVLLFLSWRVGQFFFKINIPYLKVGLAISAVAVAIWITYTIDSLFIRIFGLVLLVIALFFGTNLDKDIKGIGEIDKQ